MSRCFSTCLRRFLLTVLVLGSVTTAVMAGPAPASSAARPHDSVPVGTDLWHLDTANGHYTQAANGLTELQLYNSPVGIPDANGWHLRDTTLGSPAPDGTVAPAKLPFGLHIATAGDGSTLASLTSEDGVSLGLGLASINGEALTAVSGRVANDTVTYAAPVASSPSDVAIRATISGLDLQMVVHSANESGSFGFTLTPDARAQLVQDADGTIRVTRALTVYSDTGTPGTEIQPEYYLQSPTATDSNTDIAAQASSGSVSMALTSDASGRGNVAITIDSSWLHDAHRVFPVRVDVPLMTGAAAADTGVFATVNSCAPSLPASPLQVIVGTSGPCVYHGQVYFNTSPLLFDTPIVSAKLYLYTPASAVPTSVQVYPNTRALTDVPLPPMSWVLPTWDSAPRIASGSAGSGQSSGSGGWQAWDVTTIVRRWVQNERTNAGLTLASASAPLSFASTLGAGSAGPALAPYLDIVYAPRPAISQYYSDGASSVYGVAGAFKTDTLCPGSTVCNGFMSVAAVANAQPSGIYGAYMRIQQILTCSTPVPSGYWQTTYNLMSNALSESHAVFPIVNFVPPDPGGCGSTYPDYNTWFNELSDFVNNMSSSLLSQITAHRAYFEIGNEENGSSEYLHPDYPTIFEFAAYALCSHIGSRLGSNYNCNSANTNNTYRVITGGMAHPTAEAGCYYPAGDENLNDANSAIQTAETNGLVSASHLGVAVHPYGYNTNVGNFWLNYYALGHAWAGPCGDLDQTISLWSSTFPSLPVLFTEDNFSPQPGSGNSTADQGTYLVDLFTWLYDLGFANGNSPIRVLWMRGADAATSGGGPLQLGIYSFYGAEKDVNITTCSNNQVTGNRSISNDYYWLRAGACY